MPIERERDTGERGNKEEKEERAMGFTGKSKSSSSSSSENWGMGLFLVFFSEDDTIINNKNKKNNPFSPSASSSLSLPSPPPSSSSSSSTSSSFRRTNSNLILTKTQSTISICALLVFVTFLLFTLSTFEPTITHTPHIHFTNSRRFLSEKTQNPNSNSSWVTKIWAYGSENRGVKISITKTSHALQGMGTLFMRGTKAMNDLIVVHVMEDDGFINGDQIRVFLRLFHRSGLTSRADIVFLFPMVFDSSVFHDIIREENDSFLKLVRHYRQLNDSIPAAAGFDVTQFVRSFNSKKDRERGEPIWGKKNRGNYSVSEGETELNYGSVLGFDTAELDPENSLSGFIERVPMSLRRWACYPMLLGRVRRNYKHIMLLDMKNLLILGDPLVRVRNRKPDSVSVYSLPPPPHNTLSSKHAKRNSDKTRSVNSAIILGGARGVRRLSNAMLTEIVRVAMTQQRKSKHPVSESGVLNQLVRNEFVLKDSVNLIVSSEPLPEVSSLSGLNGNSDSSLSLSGHAVVQRGNSNSNHDINGMIMKHICSFEVDSSVYRDCNQLKKNNKDIKL